MWIASLFKNDAKVMYKLWGVQMNMDNTQSR